MKHAIALSILSGILIGTSYIPFPPWAIFFCFAPLWWAWMKAKTVWQVLLLGWIAQAIFTLIGFNWVAHTVHEFGHMPWPVAGLALIAFASFANLNIPLSGGLWFLFAKVLKCDDRIKLLLLPLFVSIGEMIFPMIFDWHFGYTWLYAGFPAYQLADIVGFQALSTFGIFMNLISYFTLIDFQVRARTKALLHISAIVGIFLLLNVAGYIWAKRLPEPDQKAKVLAVQANIGNLEKQYAEKGNGFRDSIFSRYRMQTLDGLQKWPDVQFVVWPETAYPETLFPTTALMGLNFHLKKLVDETNKNFIIGTYGIKDGLPTNSLFVLEPGKRVGESHYHKTALLAFGEYFPGGDWFPGLYQLVPEVSHFARGNGPTILDAGGLRFGAQICYEGLFADFTRKLAQKGAQILVNVTNDSWFGTWEQPYQHGYMTLSRAIEVRRPLIRSTNTGITTAIYANGQIQDFSPLHKEHLSYFEIPYYSSPQTTIFQGFGYYLLPLFLMVWFIGVIAFWYSET